MYSNLLTLPTPLSICSLRANSSNSLGSQLGPPYANEGMGTVDAQDGAARAAGAGGEQAAAAAAASGDASPAKAGEQGQVQGHRETPAHAPYGGSGLSPQSIKAIRSLAADIVDMAVTSMEP